MELNLNPNQTDGFSFIWTIHNFSYCVQKTGECLESPCFALDTSGCRFWRLELLPRGYGVSDTFGFRLHRIVDPFKEVNQPSSFGQKPRTTFSFVEQPTGSIFVQQPTGSIFVQQPTGSIFRQQPTGSSFGQQPTGSSFGQQPTGSSFGQQPNGSSFGYLPTGSSSDNKSTYDIDYALSIRTVKGSFKEVLHKYELNENDASNYCFLKLQELHKRGTDAYLDNDKLTIKCKIYKADGNALTYQQCYARTVIGVERATHNWNLETLGNLETKKQKNLSEIPSFTMDVSLSKRILDEEKFEVVITRTDANKLYFSTCAISLLDTEKVLQSVRNEHWFGKSNREQVWTFSFIPKDNLLTQPKQNPPIFLTCDFAVSLGVVYSEIEKTVCGKTVGRPLMRSMAPDNLVPKMDPDIDDCWKDNLQSFFSAGKLSDLTIRTPRKEFPVHKVMLCAQSPVFSAMFEGDMKENRTGIVEIEDLEDDTISIMLLFVYTGTVENLDWEIASKLYFAASKYEMAALKEKCSSFIKNNLSTSNACECLILADMHSDQDMKSAVQYFVIKHSAEVMNSNEWKELMKENVKLAAETMHLMFMRNIKV